MKLTAFRVTEFRSVEDSEWIPVDDVSVLVGTNEAGKTNLLMPLWKLNPVRDGAIKLLPDLPRARYSVLRDAPEKPVFIRAKFALGDALARNLAGIAGCPASAVADAVVSRDFAGVYTVQFPNGARLESIDSNGLRTLLRQFAAKIDATDEMKSEAGHRAALRRAIDASAAKTGDTFDRPSVRALFRGLNGARTGRIPKTSAIQAVVADYIGRITLLAAPLYRTDPAGNEEVRDRVLAEMPQFVYYSNYGNLDSEIYLPHVIENLKREDLTGTAAAKARTLRILFDFVKLDPDEILSLGEERAAKQGHPTQKEIQEIAERKREREVLLTSASSQLTKRFREWWKQGNYNFRFDADGNFFRIWVSDDVRPEEIELEGRSTGLQWFLSFFLVFLVESQAAHSDAILLLDEAGLSLHPLSQRDLSAFFDGLSKTNQIVYTTHSPFMVDPDRLDRVVSVYVGDDGDSVASPDLRASERDPKKTKSIFAVHAALGLTVSDTIMMGCQPILVEGISDQIYLSGIKTYLVRHAKWTPNDELVFLPSGGTRGMKAVISIVTGKVDDTPFVVLDSDGPGRELAKHLKSSLYANAKEKVLMIADYTAMDECEIEDLVSRELLVEVIGRTYRGPDDFEDEVANGPIVPQVKAYAEASGLLLGEGWKVDLAREYKRRLLLGKGEAPSEAEVARWVRLFQNLSA